MNWQTVRNKILELLHTEEIEAMLDEFNAGASTFPAFFSGHVIPEAYQDLNNTILIYKVSSVGPGDINQFNFSIQCRQAREPDAETLGGLVYSALNRVFATVTGGRVGLQATILEAIREEENCFNVPVEVIARNNL